MVNFVKKLNCCLLFVLVFLTFTFIPVVSTSVVEETSSVDAMADYNAFDSALMQMLDQYGTLDEQVSAVSVASDEEQSEQTNRLIITTEKEISDYGAVAKAEFEQYHIFQYADRTSAEQAYDYFSGLTDVEVGFDYVVSVNSEVEEVDLSADATYTYNSWGATYVGYDTYVNSMLSANNKDDLPEVVVAVLDSGINTSHVLFEGRILHSYARSWVTETVSSQYAYEDMCGHGTHVSGTIAEATLSNVKILPLKVLNSAGKGYVSSIVSAIKYAYTLTNSSLPGLKVMNMSIGVDDSSSAEGETVGAKSTSLSNAVIDAYNNGVLSVVSAGNENRNTAYAVPANVDCAITVSAVQYSYEVSTGRCLVFHGRYTDSMGMTHWGYSNYGPHVDFAAPGTSIYSAYIGSSTARASESGTSMAAPHVTAAVALIYSNPDFADYDFKELLTLLKQNADKSQLHLTGQFPVSSAERDDYYGYGLISVKNIGILTSGYVVFSNQNEMATTSFNLSLDYDGEYNKTEGEYVKIYYSTDEDVLSLDLNSLNKLTYSASKPIKITKTTKVTAVAYVYDADNKIIKKSHSCSFTYYFDNIDLSVNFTFGRSNSGLVITKYTGKLQTLKIQSEIGGDDVVAIDEGAFNDSKVKVLYLPDVDNFKFNNRAFYSNSIIEKVVSLSPSLQIGNEAFRYCSNLSDISVEFATKVGNFAFANNTKLNSLYLPYVTEIGQHAISGSNIQTIFIGQKIQSIGAQSNLSLNKVYGYESSVARSFADENDIEFYDLTLRILDDFSPRKIVKQSDGLVLELSLVGYNAQYVVNSSVSSSFSSVMNPIEDYSYQIRLTFSNLSIGENEVSITLTDRFGNFLTSNSTKVVVLPNNAVTYTISFEEGCYEIYVDGEVLDSETQLFEGYDYEIEILAKSGYEIQSISLNSENVTSPVTVSALASDLTFDVSTKEKEVLDIDFVLDEGGVVLVDGVETLNSTIARNESFVFTVQPDMGYKVDKVTFNGQKLESVNGCYSIENVMQDLVIEIDFSLLKYSITVTAGKGGSVFRKGVLTDSTDVAFGSDLEFDIVCSDGYVVDFVTVNGEKISFKNNSFKIENVSQDCDIIVSFKTSQGSLFDSENSAIFTYFIIFAVLFVLFIVAKVLLSVYRKKKKNN